ncbi:MAG: DNA primase [Candidatus Scalindua rubra]|uniref:DNA primase n=1 Tax=Candidatus Scalindua rubra TaxID=1872076 RepID=A0A1E3XC35_9BACT|nr:MAG: DNA primase [Candidatus Scalindua rubra]
MVTRYIYEQIKKDAESMCVELDWAIERRRTYLDNQIGHCKGKKKELFTYLANSNELEGELIIKGLNDWDKIIENYEIEKSLLKPNKNKNSNGITDEMIEKAKQYPIENLLPNPARRNMTNCVAHSPDKNPSMSIKNNYAYCFSCGFKGSVIDVAMKLNGTDFKSTVRELGG